MTNFINQYKPNLSTKFPQFYQPSISNACFTSTIEKWAIGCILRNFSDIPTLFQRIVLFLATWFQTVIGFRLLSILFYKPFANFRNCWAYQSCCLSLINASGFFFFFPFLILFFFYRDFLEMFSNLNIFNWHILMSPTLHEFKYMHSRLFFDDSPVCKNVIIDVMATNDFHTYL